MGFDAGSVAALSYDFRSFPLDGATEPSQRCTGRGIIPEPSRAQLEAFYAAAGDFVAVGDEDGGVEEKVYQALSDVCSGKPSVAELRQLPPRILFEFSRYVMEAVAPKA